MGEEAARLPISMEVQKLKLLVKAVQLETPTMPKNIIGVPPNDHLMQKSAQNRIVTRTNLPLHSCHHRNAREQKYKRSS